ncbi:hypothetical protein OEG92_05395 [Polaribacter sejongensis]|uniref:hypothetical protein n=1 Tax=Polaribacter sejongensis TaxID=985043 RepID=UPI0035A6408F
MTNHYNIHLVKAKTDLKVTYRDGKFRKLEHLRGALDQESLNAMGRVVPKEEQWMELFKVNWQGKVIYTDLSEAKEVSLFSKFNSVWFQFFAKENNGTKPKFTECGRKSTKPDNCLFKRGKQRR